MEFNKATISITKEFPTMKCTCGVEFVLMGLQRLKNDYDEETINVFYQQSKTVYCPYCGKRGDD